MRRDAPPFRSCAWTYLALLALTALTAWVSFQDLGRWGAAGALAIASAKAALVALVFMNVRRSGPLVSIAALLGVFWLAVLIGLSLADFGSRDWLPPPAGW